MQRVVAAAFLCMTVLCAAAALALAQRGVVEQSSFKAFYCAGEAVRNRRNPYLVEPLRSCERRLAPGFAPQPGYVEPAPLPGYVLLAFAVLSNIPVRLAAAIYSLLLVLAGAAAALALGSLLRASALGVLLALLPLLLLNVAFGEFAPFAVCALCLCAYFLSTRRWVPAGIAVSVALLQPNVGLAAVIGVFIFAPRARTAILCCIGLLALGSVAALGIAGNLDYFRIVLPSQAAAELLAGDQYSLSRVLYVAGVHPEASILLAKLSYVLVGASAVAVAGAIARRSQSPAFLALVPPAAVLFGGIYVHDIQMIFAVPAALLVARRSDEGVARAVAFAAAVLLAMVWTQRADRAAVALDAVAVVGCAVTVLSGRMLRRAALGGLCAAVALVFLLVLQRIEPPLNGSSLVTSEFSAQPGEYATTAWLRYLRATPSLNAPHFVLKLPTWAGLLLFFYSAFALPKQFRPVPFGLREPQLANEPLN